MAKVATKKVDSAPVGLSLFAKAKANSTVAPAAKKAGKDRVIVQAKGFGKKIARHLELKETMENAKAELELLDGEIKDFGRASYIAQYMKAKRAPENFVITDAGSSVLFIAMDKYLKVTDEKKAMLESYKPELLDEKEEYGFNLELLQKYGDKISAAIEGIVGMSREDKDALITNKTVYTVKKGAIKELAVYGNKLEEVFNAIEPIVSLKGGI